ncbi:speckle targeted PIP5K1A-regulated poly(A) polymerase-like isoform X2 [Oratosquilla oratoria]|uniref:speckle targeted PIP5K1A-regulated poly(A) polymerase-like isoform X2 n=1 Tax=Oratosquilla oratoria TaxID=337810 RepID=UPI003F77276A
MADSCIEMRKCGVCQTPLLDKLQFISHLLGKKHQKNYKNKNTPGGEDVEADKSVYVSGYLPETPDEAVVVQFWKYGIESVFPSFKFMFITFESADACKRALKSVFYVRDRRLTVSPKRKKETQQRKSVEDGVPPVSDATLSLMEDPTPHTKHIDVLIQRIINDIELKGSDYQLRQGLRMGLQNMLRQQFPGTITYIFGSSANNLGFKGCDVDMYAELGVDVWATGSKAEQERNAADLTWFLSREIRKTKFGYQIQAVPRARVPIVKFQDAKTGLQVDLSFKNRMPVFNTRLIHLYTTTHQLGIAGGGQPTYLLTNYALTMMMLFCLMQLENPVIPPIVYLRKQASQYGNVGNTFVNGWNCDFGQNIIEWQRKYHNYTIIELVRHFFKLYADFNYDDLVICPLLGKTLTRDELYNKKRHQMDPCMDYYCRQNVTLQLDTPLCIQDPFDLSHNTSRGLRCDALIEFVYKCKVAGELCDKIIDGECPLSKLMDKIEVKEKLPAKNPGTKDTPKDSPKASPSKDEVITLDDSDVNSQDSIEILDEEENVKNGGGKGIGKKKKTAEKNSDEKKKTAEKNSDDEDIVVTQVNGCRIDENPSTSSGNGESADKSNPLLQPYNFSLSYTDYPHISIDAGGKVEKKSVSVKESDHVAVMARDLVNFSLSKCLKIDVQEEEDGADEAEVGEKRESVVEEGISKRRKIEDGQAVEVQGAFSKIAVFKCSAMNEMWVGRKKVSKQVLSSQKTPLEREVEITSIMLKSLIVNTDEPILEFTTTLWQEKEEPRSVCVVCETNSSKKAAHMGPMFIYFSALVQNLHKKIVNHLKEK